MAKKPQSASPQHPPSPGEEGYLLVGAIVLMALVLIALAVAAPVIAKDLRRDKEVESMHRQEQYVRAIRLYQRKFPNQYPPSIEALEKSNNIRFLRQQYIDPLTGKADWRIIHVGQNQTTVKGFFGEPLGGLTSTGLGSAAGSASPGQPGSPSSTGTSINTGCNASNSAFCDPKATTSTSGGDSGGPAGLGSAASGGGPIMGVGTSRTGDSILTPNEQSTYETWEFLYDPRIELMYKKGALNGGIGSQNASAFGQDATGAGTGKNGLGTGSGTSTGTPGTTTPTPQ